jgi:hypothetical protein
VIWPMIMSVMGTVLFDEPYVKEFPLAVRSTSHVLSTHAPPSQPPFVPRGHLVPDSARLYVGVA